MIHPEVVNLIALYTNSPFFDRTYVPQNWDYDTIPNELPPREMVCGPPNERGYAKWRLVDSPIDDSIIDGIERFLGISLPPLFASYLKYKCLLEVDLNLLMLPRVDPRHPLGWLEWTLKHSASYGLQDRPWLIPFADSAAQMGCLCFDTRYPDGNGDYPIINIHRVEPFLSNNFAEIKAYASFGEFLEFAYNYLRWVDYVRYTTSEPLRLESWLSGQGLTIPNIVPHVLRRG